MPLITSRMLLIRVIQCRQKLGAHLCLLGAEIVVVSGCEIVCTSALWRPNSFLKSVCRKSGATPVQRGGLLVNSVALLLKADDGLRLPRFPQRVPSPTNAASLDS